MQRPDAAGGAGGGDAPGAAITRDAFSRPGFSAVAFVNAALGGAAGASAAAHDGDGGSSAAPHQPSLEAALSNALVRLQLLAQECSDRSDGHMARVLAALPRARRELRAGVGEVDALTGQLRAITDGCGAASAAEGGGAVAAPSSGSGGVGASYIATLEALDAARGRLAGAARLLSLAASWDRLLREGDNDPALAALLGGPAAPTVAGGAPPQQQPPSLARLSEHLSSLEACAGNLAGLPGAPARAATVAAARAGFTAAALPVLSDALARRDGAALAACVGVFESVGRAGGAAATADGASAVTLQPSSTASASSFFALRLADALGAHLAAPLVAAQAAAAPGSDGASASVIAGAPLVPSPVAAAVARELLAPLAPAVSAAASSSSTAGGVDASVGAAWTQALMLAASRVLAAELPALAAAYAAAATPADGGSGEAVTDGAAAASAAALPRRRALQIGSRAVAAALLHPLLSSSSSTQAPALQGLLSDVDASSSDAVPPGQQLPFASLSTALTWAGVPSSPSSEPLLARTLAAIAMRAAARPGPAVAAALNPQASHLGRLPAPLPAPLAASLAAAIATLPSLAVPAAAWLAGAAVLPRLQASLSTAAGPDGDDASTAALVASSLWLASASLSAVTVAPLLPAWRAAARDAVADWAGLSAPSQAGAGLPLLPAAAEDDVAAPSALAAVLAKGGSASQQQQQPSPPAAAGVLSTWREGLVWLAAAEAVAATAAAPSQPSPQSVIPGLAVTAALLTVTAAVGGGLELPGAVGAVDGPLLSAAVGGRLSGAAIRLRTAAVAAVAAGATGSAGAPAASAPSAASATGPKRDWLDDDDADVAAAAAAKAARASSAADAADSPAALLAPRAVVPVARQLLVTAAHAAVTLACAAAVAHGVAAATASTDAAAAAVAAVASAAASERRTRRRGGSVAVEPLDDDDGTGDAAGQLTTGGVSDVVVSSATALTVAADPRALLLAANGASHPARVREWAALQASLRHGATAAALSAPTSSLEAAAASVIGGLLSDGASGLAALLPAAAAAVPAAVAASYAAAYATLLAPVASALAGVRSLPQWCASGGGSGASAAGSGGYGYSLQPSPYAVATGDALLALVTALAPAGHPLLLQQQQASASASAFAPAVVLAGGSLQAALAADEGSGDTVPASPPQPPSQGLVTGVHASLAAALIPACGWAEVRAALGALGLPASAAAACDVGGDDVPLADRAAGLAALGARLAPAGAASAWASASGAVVALPAASSAGSPSAAASSQQHHHLASEAVTSEATLWLHALTRGAAGLLLGELAGIPRLDAAGAAQLGADVAYLATVTGAVGVGHLGAGLGALADLAAAEAGEVAKTAAAAAGRGADAAAADAPAAVRAAVAARLAAQRGLPAGRH